MLQLPASNEFLIDNEIQSTTETCLCGSAPSPPLAASVIALENAQAAKDSLASFVSSSSSFSITEQSSMVSASSAIARDSFSFSSSSLSTQLPPSISIPSESSYCSSASTLYSSSSSSHECSHCSFGPATRIRAGLRILSNLAAERVTTASFRIPISKLGWKVRKANRTDHSNRITHFVFVSLTALVFQSLSLLANAECTASRAYRNRIAHHVSCFPILSNFVFTQLLLHFVVS
jgi:hypothetical protein